MKVVTIQEADADRARVRLSAELGIPPQNLKFLKKDDKQCSFEVLYIPASIEVIVSPDKMRATLKRIKMPLGDKAPALTTDLVIELLKKKGVLAGHKVDAIAREVHQLGQDPTRPPSVDLELIVAEGQKPQRGQAAPAQWMIDLPALKSSTQVVMVGREEVLARADASIAGKNGFDVSGQVLPAPLDETKKLDIGPGITIQSTGKELLYVTQQAGRLFLDPQGRLRVQWELLRRKEGMEAAVEVHSSLTVTGKSLQAKDLLAFAKSQGVSDGFLTEKEIQDQLSSAPQWPWNITLARGVEPVDGLPGDVLLSYNKTQSSDPLEQERVKEAIVFPGDEVLVIRQSKPPRDGRTPFGEVLKGKESRDLPIYPGRGVEKEVRGQDIVFKATTYGRVKIEADRAHVTSIATISRDAMKVVIDLFPQKLVPASDILATLREMEVLVPVDKDKLEASLLKAHQGKKRIKEFPLAVGKAPEQGADAKIEFKFDPEDFKEKGLLSLKAKKTYWVAPGDLVMIKTLPIKPQDGMNVFRERIAVSKMMKPKDTPVRSGKQVDEIDLGEENNSSDPARIEFRALTFGTLIWKDGMVDVKPSLLIGKNDLDAKLPLLPRSSFSTTITEEMIQKFADEEEIKVPLDWPSIRQVLKLPLGSEPQVVTIAKAVEPKHGEMAKIRYFVQYNGKAVEELLGPGKKDEKPKLCDCVRPGDVLAIKTPATNGEDGKTIFGRRIPADRGLDEPFPFGFGVEKSDDGLQLFCSLTTPGFVSVERGKLVCHTPVQISKDRMSVTITLYPSKSARFALTEEKVVSMLTGTGVTSGIKNMAIRDALEQINETNEAVENLLVAEGRPAGRGRDTVYRFTIDTGNAVGELRADGSIDFKSKNVFQSVKKGQLLVIKQLPTQGDDGSDVKGNIIPGAFGIDMSLQPGAGTEVSENGLEYRATINGILEVLPKSLRVIPGLLISGDVGPKTGNIQSQDAQVFVTGGVLPDFEVRSGADIGIEKVAEACKLIAVGSIRVRGGIVGKDRAFVSAGKDLHAHYIEAGARIEVEGDVKVHNEVVNSTVITGGWLECIDGAGVIVGGDLKVFQGLKCRTLGSAGAETPTVVTMGAHLLEQRRIEEEMRAAGLTAQIEDLEKQLEGMNSELREMYDRIPEVTKTSLEEAQKLQAAYKKLYDQRNEKAAHLKAFLTKRDEFLARVPVNWDVSVQVRETLQPGTTFVFQETRWVLKEPMRGVEIRWNKATSNFYTKRL
jgi:uncharacterized protein (DUF342 family)